jgi:glycosyltransferase involved in cell wall biosynthesis
MTVSVVVPTYGRRDLVTRCLTSLASQDERDFEVIVVDDGADPSLGAHVAALGLSLAVRVVSHAVNRGRSAARNTGIEHASGEVVAFLDGDMTVVPSWVRAHREAHEGGDTVVLGNIVTAPGIRRNAFVEYIDSRGVKKVAAGSDIPSRYFMTGNSSVAKPLLMRAGVFDEDFREYGGEDTEMGYRLAHKGGRFRYAPDAVYAGEPFLLARALDQERTFVYVAIPEGRLAEVQALAPLERIRIVGRARSGAAAFTGSPILDLMELARVR